MKRGRKKGVECHWWKNKKTITVRLYDASTEDVLLVKETVSKINQRNKRNAQRERFNKKFERFFSV